MKKSISIFFYLFLLTIVLFSCGKHGSKDNPVGPSEADVLETQRIVNSYFHSEVIPKLADGWKAFPDSNKAVTYHYRFTRNKDRWSFSQMDKVESSLSGHTDTIAQLFMAKAVIGTSFPIEKNMANDTLLDLYWTWPVPFPEGTFDPGTGNFTALRPNGGVTGGCDGRGTKAHCTICGAHDDCPLVCVGYQECANQGDGSCWELNACASGGPFGRFSGVVIQ